MASPALPAPWNLASVTFTQKDPQLLGRTFRARLRKLEAAEQEARVAAARTATAFTRASFHYMRPSDAPARTKGQGRPTTSGKFPQTALNWVAQKGVGGQVKFDIARADQSAFYWIILEIGTGNSATMFTGGKPNPVGAPGPGASYKRRVKKQKGRRIPNSLAWGTGPNGQYVAPGDGHGQQLYLVNRLSNRPIGPVTSKGRTAAGDMYIGREIKPQNFVQKGGQQAFGEYRISVLAAARSAFARV